MASAIIGGGISAIGGLIGAGMQSAAIRKAADIQATTAAQNAQLEKGATTGATQFTQDQLNRTLANISPYQQAGAGALSRLSAGTAAGGEFASTPTGEQVLAQDPGYAFRLQQGQLALSRAEAAGGGVGSGGALKAAAQYGQDYASSEYNNAFNRFMTTRQANYANLANIAGYGMNANQLGASAGGQAAGLYGNELLSGTGAQVGQLSDEANARAAGIIGSANAWSGALSNIGTAAQQGFQGWAAGQAGRQALNFANSLPAPAMPTTNLANLSLGNISYQPPADSSYVGGPY
jgi:hypothetical protein